MNDIANQQEMSNSSKAYALFYAFFLIPLMITIFAVLFFFLFKMLTYEPRNAYDLLNNINSGSVTKRCQSAFELSTLMSDPLKIPDDDLFVSKLSMMYAKSKNDDDSRVRYFLALTMGQTNNSVFCDDLNDGLQDSDLNNRMAAIESIGMIECKESVNILNNMINSEFDNAIKLKAIGAVGQIGDITSIPLLKIALDNEEPNIRWDAALALAKLDDKSGYHILRNLLTRNFFNNFSSVNHNEIDNIILLVLTILDDVDIANNFKEEIVLLSKTEENIKIRDFAMQIVSDY